MRSDCIPALALNQDDGLGLQDKDSLSADLDRLIPQLETLMRSNAELEDQAARQQTDPAAADMAAAERTSLQQRLDEQAEAAAQLQAQLDSQHAASDHLQQQLHQKQQVLGPALHRAVCHMQQSSTDELIIEEMQLQVMPACCWHLTGCMRKAWSFEACMLASFQHGPCKNHISG